MNYTTAILVVNDKARAVKVTYEAEDNAPRSTFKTLDETIEVGDYVVVPTNTRHNLTVCKVVEVDVDDWIGTSQQIEWVVGRVDLSDISAIKLHEDEAITKIKQAEKLKQRRELKANLEAALAEDKDAIALLATSPLDAKAIG